MLGPESEGWSRWRRPSARRMCPHRCQGAKSVHLRFQKNFPERVLTQHLYPLLMTWKEIRDFKILGHLINSTPPSAPSV